LPEQKLFVYLRPDFADKSATCLNNEKELKNARTEKNISAVKAQEKK